MNSLDIINGILNLIFCGMLIFIIGYLIAEIFQDLKRIRELNNEIKMLDEEMDRMNKIKKIEDDDSRVEEWKKLIK